MKRSDQNQNAPLLRRQMGISRLRDILIFIPLMAMVIFLSPLMNMTQSSTQIFMVPSNIFIIFMFWFLLILAVALTNRSLKSRLEQSP